MKFYIADAFTDKSFGGNPAGVVILDDGISLFPEESLMIKVAAELKYSETAFIMPLANGDFEIRYFTPVSEVDLCGHATICSIFCLMEQGLIKAFGSTIRHIVTKAGRLSILIENGKVMMDMGSVEFGKELATYDELKEIADIMGISIDDIGLKHYDSKNNQLRSLPQMVSTGLFDIILPLNNHQALKNISPDFSRLSKLSEKYEVVGVHAFCLNNSFSSSMDSKDNSLDETLAFCRNFAPLYAIDEEAATGTANGALLAYLYERNLIQPNVTYKIEQGESMDRPSAIFGLLTYDSDTANEKLDKKNPPIIKIGGNAKILVKGEIFI
jgi:PhzF family phenazine biosynthesis protein